MNISVFFIFCITFIFYLLGDFAFSLGDFSMPYYFIVGNVVLAVMLVRNFQYCFSAVNNLIKTKAGRYLLYFFVWVIITILVSMIQKTFMFNSFITNFIGNFFNSFLYPMLVIYILTTQLKTNKKLKLFLFIISFIILAIGLIELFALTFNINIVKDFLSAIVNRNNIAFDSEKVFALAGDKPRVASIFREPGEYAGFLVVISPIFFYLGTMKEKLFKNIFVDIFLKRLLIVMWVFNLMKTQSPINIVFACLVLAGWCIINIKSIIKNLLKVRYILVLCFIIISLAGITIYSIVNEELFVTRITTTLSNLSSVDAIVENEPSLATRICTHEAQIKMGIDHPIFGVGYSNMNSEWGKYVLNLPHAVTTEVYIYAINNQQKGGSSFTWKILAETGFVGLFLLYAFWITMFKGGLRAAKRSKERDFIYALSYSLLIYICFSWYLMLATGFLAYYGILLYFIVRDYKIKQYLIRRSTK